MLFFQFQACIFKHCPDPVLINQRIILRAFPGYYAILRQAK